MTIGTMNGIRAPEFEEELHEGSHYASPCTPQLEEEADPFLPLPLGAKALPMIAKRALPAVRKLLPSAKRAVGRVVRSVMGRQAATPQATRQAFAPAQSQLFGEGELMAEQAEAEFFGANEHQAELAGHETAHEAALTEVLAAEAAHTTSESEAEALLGAALPITIRAMGASRTARPVYPTLARGNSRLVRGIRGSSPAGGQLLRLVPCIQRRAVASLLAAHRAGRPITPQLVVRVLAGQAARVMGNPQTCRRALLRNTAIRQGTVARVGRHVRRRAAGF